MIPMPPNFDDFRKEPTMRQKCQWPGCEEAHGETKWAIDPYNIFCSLFCREEYFSSIGGGDARGAEPNRASIQDHRYIQSRPSPA